MDTAGAGAFGTVGDSFSSLIVQSLTNTGGATTSYAVVKAGFWEFQLFGYLDTNFAILSAMQIFLQPTAGGNPTIYLVSVGSLAAAPPPVVFSRTIQLVLSQDFSFLIQMGTSGVGQTIQHETIINGNRLL